MPKRRTAKAKRAKAKAKANDRKGDGTVVATDFVLRNRFRQEIFNYSEPVDLANIISSNLPSYGAFDFQLSNLGSVSDFANLYDSYRIRGVEVVFRPVCVQMLVSGSSSTDDSVQNVPEMFTAIDLDDKSTPTSVAQVQRYSTMVQTLATSGFRRVFQPRYLVSVYNGLSSAYVLGDSDAWLDLANTGIPHYGLKWAMTPDSGGNNGARFVYAVTVLYHVQFWRRR